ncbi:MAG: DUF2478 domain-containing protein [Paracoccus sp. (in: a-proteobacteria)]|uniref:DUF2478 domain-containing protein n=1 Tax=Paracoccus sp. TaxID=267 RepID=UPI0026E0E900|nr:DUF2478 domain-containing protein [Paracoccus sp. (in: a-proteobacteria)]MDO5621687.1 DUF2478 domain-containing protein [Paracoccus sp. (in: a-proteobacteria)]
MLAFFTLSADARGTADRLLTVLAERLAQDHAVTGAVQVNADRGADCACDMDLTILGADLPPIRISQSLGSGSTGCRLLPEGLEQAAAEVEARLAGADLVILSKFAKQESFGRGFCSTIAAAIQAGVPVVLHVPAEYRTAFTDFAGDMAHETAPEALEGWCRRVIAAHDTHDT